MTLPSVLQASTFQKDDANASSFEVNRPAGLTNGNTLLIIFACDGNRIITLTADGFTELANVQEGTVTIRAGFLKIDGSEPSTFTVTTSAGERAAAVVYEIQDAADPDVTAPTQSSTTGASNTPDPTSHTPAGGAQDFLWVAAIGVDRDKTIDSFPSNMTIGSSEQNRDGATANSCSIGTDTHQLNAASFDPTAFGISASEGFAALTISVFPVPPPPTGIGTQTLDNYTQAGIGIMQPSGAAAQTLDDYLQAGVGVERFTANGAQLLANLLQSGTGLLNPDATGAQLLADLLQAGTGVERFTSTGAQLLAQLLQAGEGQHVDEATGTGIQLLAQLLQSGEGQHIENATGTGIQLLSAPLQVGVGEQRFIGTGVQLLSPLLQSGGGLMHPDGSGQQFLAQLLQTGTSQVILLGTGSQLLTTLLQIGTGLAPSGGVDGVGASILQALGQLGAAIAISRVSKFIVVQVAAGVPVRHSADVIVRLSGDKGV